MKDTPVPRLDLFAVVESPPGTFELLHCRAVSTGARVIRYSVDGGPVIRSEDIDEVRGALPDIDNSYEVTGYFKHVIPGRNVVEVWM